MNMMCNQLGRRIRAAESILLLLASIIAANGFIGCHTSSKEKTSANTAVSPARCIPCGVVVSVDVPKGQITLTNENIPGFMEPMTMPYTLANASVASELHPGDKIAAQLTVGDTSATLDQIDILQQAKLDYKPMAQYHIPRAGDLVPDFALLNQNGPRIRFDQYRGKVLLVTFIYTRCPFRTTALDESKFCHRRQNAGRRPEVLCENALAQHQL